MAAGTLAFAILMAGCGGNGGPPPSNTLPIVRSSVVILGPNTHVPSINPNAVSLNGVVPVLKPGVIIITPPKDAATEGFLRQVTSAPTTSGDTTTVQTTPKSLEDVFERAHVEVHQQVAGNSLTVRSVHPGFHVQLSHGKSNGVTRDPVTVTVNATLAGSGNTAVTLTGTLNIAAAVDMDCQIDNGVIQSASVNPSVSGTSNLTVTGNATGSSLNQTVLVTTLDGAPITVMVGPVPVVFTPHISVYASLNGTAQPGVSFTFGNSYALLDGVTWSRSGGVTPLQKSTHSGDTFSATGNPLAALTSTVAPFAPQISLDLFDNPLLIQNWSAPSIALTYTRQTSPIGTDINAVATYNDGLTLNGNLIGPEVPSQQFPNVTNQTFPLTQQPIFIPDNASVSVGVQ